VRTKVTLVLIFLNVALFYYIFFVREDHTLVPDQTRVLGPEAANIQTLTIVNRNAPTIQLERRGSKWFLTRPVAWPAQEFAIRSILNELLLLRSLGTFTVEEILATGRTLAEYGLDDPPLTLTIPGAATPGAPAPEPITLRIGSATQVNNRLYILSPDGKYIHVVPRSLAENLARPLQALRSDELFTIPAHEARSLNLEPANGSRIRVRSEGNRWYIEGLSISQVRANKLLTELALSRLRALHVHSFVPDSEGASARAALANPPLRITIEGTNRRETLLLGPPAPRPPEAEASAATSATDDPPEPSTLYYALMEADEIESSGEATLFTVSVPDAFLKDTLLNAQLALREKQILDLDPTTLSSIAITPAQSREETILQRLESSASNDWQVVRRSPDQPPVSEPAERALVERLVTTLLRLSAEEFIDVASEAQKEAFGFNVPARTLTFTTTGSPAPVRLLIGTSQDRHNYAKFAHQEYIYRISDDILNEIPVSPLHYRQRLVRELPESTSITHLRLTDLASGEVIFETPIPVPDASQHDPEMVSTLVGHFRTLRAKAFVAGEVQNTVTISGEERPWKYRLEAALASAGGGPATSTLLLSDRIGGDFQLAGFGNVVFEIEQPLLDALFLLTYGARDPGPPEAPAPEQPAQEQPSDAS